MSDTPPAGARATGTPERGSLRVRTRAMRRRRSAERRFRLYGIAAITVSILSLAVLLASVFSTGATAFEQAYLTFPIKLDAATLDPGGHRAPAEMRKVTTFTYGPLIAGALKSYVHRIGAADGASPDEIAGLVSKAAAAELRDRVLANPDLVGRTIGLHVLASGRIDGYLKGRVTRVTAALDKDVSVGQLDLADRLRAAGVLGLEFNPQFLTGADASDQRPEAAGVGVAILGSVYMMLVVLVLALPIGVAASIYLEEFAPKNRLTDLIEVNINNLAAVPSIVFGILGLAIFINFAGLPQATPIVGGLVLTLMTLPTIIIATRAALRAVPPSIRQAALGIGASRMQSVFHHVLPLAMPGILTGTIIGLAHALGETAPLLLIGMVAFVADMPAAPPEGLLDPASALPVQVFNWTQRADPAFVERASGAIIVLLGLLFLMNLAAILLRRRFERRW